MSDDRAGLAVEMSDDRAGLSTPVPPESRVAAFRRRFLRKPDVAAAVVTWLVATPLALLLVRALDLNPFSTKGAVMPLAVGSAVAGVLLLLWLRTRSEAVIGVCVGAFAAWISLTIAASLHGTPFGIAGLGGDAGRLVSMMTRFTTTWRSADGVVHNLPTEYPPLYPWLVGHIAAAVDRPAWRLVADAQILTMGLAVVLCYALWRLLVGPRTALVIVALVPAGFASPNLDYEVISLLVLLPWAIATFGAAKYGPVRLHWLPAGIIGGLIVLMYPGFLYFSLLGLAALVLFTLRVVVPRRAYLLHLLGVIAVAFVVASWYLVPYFYTALTKGGDRVSDTYLPVNIAQAPLVFPFLDATPLGLVQLIGLFGLFWYRRSWWGLPLLSIAGGVVVYRVFYLLRAVHDGHTGYLAHTVREFTAVLAIAGVLTVATAAPEVFARLRIPATRLRDVTGVAVAVLVAWAAVQGWHNWMPGPPRNRTAAVFAHTEPWPDGHVSRFAPSGPPKDYFRAGEVDAVIRSTLGTNARPVVLSFSQRLYAFYPYYGYATPGRDASNSLQHWDLRQQALRRLAAIEDPAAFAQAAAHTPYGPIDVFVLNDRGNTWGWPGVRFRPASFSDHFTVFHLEGKTVVAIRKA